MINIKSTVAIVVAYYPDINSLQILCAQLSKNAEIIVVDNTPSDDACVPIFGVHWIALGNNLGIGAAQNIGIRKARELSAEIVTFFDQDSKPSDQLLPSLIESLGNPPIGVSAPVCVDLRTGFEYPPFSFNFLGWAKPVPCIGLNKPVNVDLIISSGSAVSMQVFDDVGLMNEDLFIDYVDLEWCMRCKEKSVPILVNPTVYMPHTIGDNVINFNFLTTFIHSPIRTYYKLRNPFLLLRMKHVPKIYAFHEVAAAMVHHIVQLRFAKNRVLHLKVGCAAVLDGILGKNGKLQSLIF